MEILAILTRFYPFSIFLLTLYLLSAPDLLILFAFGYESVSKHSIL